jgi:hypothetical protein
MNSPLQAILAHLKEKGHTWALALGVLAGGLYLWRGVQLALTEQELVANGVLTLVAAMTVGGGATALIGMAIMSKSDFGELTEFRIHLITGVVIGVITSTIKLLSLFGVLHAAPSGRHPAPPPHETAAPANR